ncbi:unnamed protein product [Leptosia nina]|uniref:ATP synthase F0 subunit 8 n=1 Tax=Leptosia nina TaxID=320188 RepID=A0AAV1JC05_9NEOP
MLWTLQSLLWTLLFLLFTVLWPLLRLLRLLLLLDVAKRYRAVYLNVGREAKWTVQACRSVEPRAGSPGSLCESKLLLAQVDVAAARMGAP